MLIDDSITLRIPLELVVQIMIELDPILDATKLENALTKSYDIKKGHIKINGKLARKDGK